MNTGGSHGQIRCPYHRFCKNDGTDFGKSHPGLAGLEEAAKNLLGQADFKAAGQAERRGSNIEVTEKDIRRFTQTVKKYHVDFAPKKDITSEQPRFLGFFKSQDADAITATFQEFTVQKPHMKPSLCALLARRTLPVGIHRDGRNNEPEQEMSTGMSILLWWEWEAAVSSPVFKIWMH